MLKAKEAEGSLFVKRGPHLSCQEAFAPCLPSITPLPTCKQSWAFAHSMRKLRNLRCALRLIF